jgi:hypothetical protein
MEEQNAGTIKKIGAGNKSLSVIVAEDKLAKFKKFSQGINLSMGYLLNQAIDRYLSSDSTDIFKSSIGVVGIPPTPPNIVNPELDIEELIKTSIDTYLLNHPIGIPTPPPISLSRADVEDIVNTSIGRLGLDEIIKSFIGVSDIEKIVNTSIEIAIDPITNSITELKTHTRERFEELEARSIATVTPTIDKDPSTKTWVEFFKMIGMDALKAGEARLTGNSDTRTKQATEGILAAKEQGLGDWVVKLAGQSFARVGN